MFFCLLWLFAACSLVSSRLRSRPVRFGGAMLLVREYLQRPYRLHPMVASSPQRINTSPRPCHSSDRSLSPHLMKPALWPDIEWYSLLGPFNLSTSLCLRRPRHSPSPRLNLLPIPHRHHRRLPPSGLHYGCEIDVERQHILRRPNPDRVPADLAHFLLGHSNKFRHPFERLGYRVNVEPRPDPSSSNQSPKHHPRTNPRHLQPSLQVLHRIRRQIRETPLPDLVRLRSPNDHPRGSIQWTSHYFS